MEYILNISSGVLHTKPCADGKTGEISVDPGRRKHYLNYEKAIKDKLYNHNHIKCLVN